MNFAFEVIPARRVETKWSIGSGLYSKKFLLGTIKPPKVERPDTIGNTNRNPQSGSSCSIFSILKR